MAAQDDILHWSGPDGGFVAIGVRARSRQADAIRSRLAARGLKATTVDTANRLQSREFGVTLV